MSVVDKILRLGEGRKVKQYQNIVNRINQIEPTFEELSDHQLQNKTNEFKERISNGETLDSILVEAFAAVREASKRTLGQRHFDVQLIGGLALHEGNIAEMKTGEGKTLVATAPSYLNSLSGKGVHVVTVNDYLASYQSRLMSRVYNALGVSVGCVLTNTQSTDSRKQYAKDITYGTNNTFGFDYLRDNMTVDPQYQVQREHNFAIIDEVDSILIDEARTPLIISGATSGDGSDWYKRFSQIVKSLILNEDYEIDEKKKTAGILESGIHKVETSLGIDNLYEDANTPLVGYLNNALRAKELFLRDRDYVVSHNEVKIVDEHTGRILDGRRYSDGMHQAIEAKENVKIQEENQTYATITLQNYFRMYNKLSGMTGTALTEAAEFQATYKLGVVEIPTNRPMIRKDLSDVIYRTATAKYNAIADDVEEKNKTGQPVLIGTISVEKSEILSSILRQRGIKHSILNAKEHAREAEIVAMAGRENAVTVATNMAGRGTDIMLGGNDEFIAISNMKNDGFDQDEDSELYEKNWPKYLSDARKQVEDERERVRELGGLYVIGSERHESRRIDNQLQGRSGRQGDPGASKFYISLEDDLMRLFNTNFVNRILETVNAPEDMPLEHKAMTRSIRNAQGQIESRNFEIRKNVLKYDEVMNKQRNVIYKQRNRVLFGEDITDQIYNFIYDVIEYTVDDLTIGLLPSEWNHEMIASKLNLLYTGEYSIDKVMKWKNTNIVESITADDIIDWVIEDAEKIYKQREELVGSQVIKDVQKHVVLTVLDRRWRAHLAEMDYLKEGIGLRAMAQRDPLVEYTSEASKLFEEMNYSIKEDIIGLLFNLKIKAISPEPVKNNNMENLTFSAPDDSTIGESTLLNEAQAPNSHNDNKLEEKNAKQAEKSYSDGQTYTGTPKNSPCPCQSGKKYKLCHGKNEFSK